MSQLISPLQVPLKSCPLSRSRSNAIWAQRNGTYEDASLEGRVRRLLAL